MSGHSCSDLHHCRRQRSFGSRCNRLGPAGCRGRRSGSGHFCLADGADHVQGAFRIRRKFIVEDALAAVQGVGQADQLSLQPSELFGREKRLRQEALEPARAHHDFPVFRRNAPA